MHYCSDEAHVITVIQQRLFIMQQFLNIIKSTAKLILAEFTQLKLYVVGTADR